MPQNVFKEIISPANGICRAMCLQNIINKYPHPYPDSDCHVELSVRLLPELPGRDLAGDDHVLLAPHELEVAPGDGAHQVVDVDRDPQERALRVPEVPRQFLEPSRLGCPSDQASQSSFRDITVPRELVK